MIGCFVSEDTEKGIMNIIPGGTSIPYEFTIVDIPNEVVEELKEVQ